MGRCRGEPERSGLCWEDLFPTETPFQSYDLKEGMGQLLQGPVQFCFSLPAVMAPGRHCADGGT